MASQEKEFNLLHGKLSAQDAKEIMVTLFNDKIQYHRLRNFSHEERFGKPDPHSVERIPELKKALEGILGYLKQHDADTLFEIHADIMIKAVGVTAEVALQ